MAIVTVGIDLAKNGFAVHGVDGAAVGMVLLVVSSFARAWVGGLGNTDPGAKPDTDTPTPPDCAEHLNLFNFYASIADVIMDTFWVLT
jgi:hypothetical protein